MIINCAVVFVYSSKFQQVDEEDYGGPLEIAKEGLFTAFAVFLVGAFIVNQHNFQKASLLTTSVYWHCCKVISLCWCIEISQFSQW